MNMTSPVRLLDTKLRLAVLIQCSLLAAAMYPLITVILQIYAKMQMPTYGHVLTSLLTLKSKMEL